MSAYRLLFYNVPWCQLHGWTKKKLGSTFFATIHVLHTVFVGQQMPQLKQEHLRLVEFFLHYNCIYCSWPSVVKACFKAGGRHGGQLPPPPLILRITAPSPFFYCDDLFWKIVSQLRLKEVLKNLTKSENLLTIDKNSRKKFKGLTSPQMQLVRKRSIL